MKQSEMEGRHETGTILGTQDTAGNKTKSLLSRTNKHSTGNGKKSYEET